ncbi:hypothetical protein L7H23_15445 [Sphingopyxis sp. BSN-002]|uniref:hypothetical protein n=1 Tax=Sphingopyxis sp. BSN-002 TaxID=2911495 RepID=UPI001EDBED4F|nr:hypothetical protein [Sphingopyxis sp. BSN-002]UKK83948.1 hypothetical protein L7H23_15445 [Sphingopyxis sp. BSN-002]
MGDALHRGGKFRIDLVGPFGFFAPDGERIDIRSRKAVALLALLAFAPNGLRTRGWLQAMLWGTRGQAQAQSSLRRELSTLCTILEGYGADDLLVRESQRIQLRLDRIVVDIDQLVVAPKPDAMKDKGDLLEGIDLPDCDEFEEWLLRQRGRIAELQRISIPEPDAALAPVEEVLGGPLPPTASLIAGKPPALPPKPSVAVLPFQTVAAPEVPGWLGESIAEDIGLTLAQLPQLFVVASSAAAALTERRMTPSEIARTLGVRYLLGGSVRPSASGIRTAVQLLDGSSGQQLWVQSFETVREAIASLAESVTVAVAPQIWTRIDVAERHRGLASPVARMDSYDLYWRANALYRNWQRESGLEAIQLTDELVAINPTCPLSASLAAFCNGIAYAFSWTIDREATRRAAIHHFQNTLRLGGDNVEALGYAAGTLVSIGGDMAQADRLVTHALSLLPPYQPTLFWGGWVDIANGNPVRARERFELSLRINPAAGVRNYALTGIGVSLLLAGDAATAFPLLRHAAAELQTYPTTQAALAIAAAQVGDRDAARAASYQLASLGGAEVVLRTFQDPGQRALLAAALDAAAML